MLHVTIEEAQCVASARHLYLARASLGDVTKLTGATKQPTWHCPLALPCQEHGTLVIEIFEQQPRSRRKFWGPTEYKNVARGRCEIAIDKPLGETTDEWYPLDDDDDERKVHLRWTRTAGDDDFLSVATTAASEAPPLEEKKKKRRLSDGKVRALVKDEKLTLPIPENLDILSLDRYARRAPNELQIILVQAQVPVMDKALTGDGGSTDTYFVLECDGEKATSTVKYHDLTPVFMERFDLEVCDPKKILKVTCFDKDKFSSDDFIGVVNINLEALKSKERIRQRFAMTSDDKEVAWVELVLAWRTNPRYEVALPESILLDEKDDVESSSERPPNEVTIVLLRAKNLMGTTSAYAKVKVDAFEAKTEVKPKTKCPIWIETYRFNVERSCDVVCEVYDSTFHTLVGRCSYALTPGMASGRMWRPLLKNNDVKGDLEAYIAWRFSRACYVEVPADLLVDPNPFDDLPPTELVVYLIRARNLAAMDTSFRKKHGTSDPYCVFECDGQLAKSTVKWKCLNPRWLETFRLPNVDNPQRNFICKVYDRDIVGGDDLIGQVIFPLSDLADKAPHRAWHDLHVPQQKEDDHRGSVELFCAWRHNAAYVYDLPSELVLHSVETPEDDDDDDAHLRRPNELVMYVFRGKGLPAKDSNVLKKQNSMPSSDPYVSFDLRDDTGGPMKHVPSCKTQTRQQELNPVWLETHHMWTPPEAEELQVTVYDWNAYTKPEALGNVVLPLNSITPHGQRRWYELLDESSKKKDEWLGEIELFLAYRYNEELALARLPEELDIARNPDHQANEVQIVLVRGKFLTTGEVYVTFGAGNSNATSRTKRGSTPVWRETLRLTEVDDPDEVIEVRLWDDTSQDLGGVDILMNPSYRTPVRKWFDIMPNKGLSVELIIHWRCTTTEEPPPVTVQDDDESKKPNCVEARVIGCRRLPGVLMQDHVAVDPIVTVRVQPAPDQQTRRATGRNAVFDETFVFEDIEQADAKLDIQVDHSATAVISQRRDSRRPSLGNAKKKKRKACLGRCEVPLKLILDGHRGSEATIVQWFDLSRTDDGCPPPHRLPPDDVMPPAKLKLALRWVYRAALDVRLPEETKKMTRRRNSLGKDHDDSDAPNELRLVLIRGRHLVPSTKGTAYAVATCGGYRRRSKSVRFPTGGPRWVDRLSFEADDGDHLSLDIYESNHLFGKQDRHLGSVTVDDLFAATSALAQSRSLRAWYDLQGDDETYYRGQVELLLQWVHNGDLVVPIDDEALIDRFPKMPANCLKFHIIRARRLGDAVVDSALSSATTQTSAIFDQSQQRYRVVSLLDDTDVSTRTAPQPGAHPVWNEAMKFGDVDEVTSVVRVRVEAVSLDGNKTDLVGESKLRYVFLLFVIFFLIFYLFFCYFCIFRVATFRDRKPRRIWLEMSAEKAKIEIAGCWVHDETVDVQIDEEDKVDPRLHEDPNQVTIVVIRARKLPAMDEMSSFFGASSDAYVKLTCGGRSDTTKVVRRNLNPVFKERIDFEAYDIADTVTIDVLNKGASWAHQDDLIGSASVQLSEIANRVPRRMWLDVLSREDDDDDDAKKKKKNKGQIEVCLWWHYNRKFSVDVDVPSDPHPEAAANQLIVSLIRGRNLSPVKGCDNICNAFVVLDILPPEDPNSSAVVPKNERQRSSTIDDDKWPVWTETFRFLVEPPVLDDVLLDNDQFPSLKVICRHYDDLRKRDSYMGAVHVVLNDRLASKVPLRSWFHLEDHPGSIELLLAWHTSAKKIHRSSVTLLPAVAPPQQLEEVEPAPLEEQDDGANAVCVEVIAARGLNTSLDVGSQCHVRLALITDDGTEHQQQRTTPKVVNRGLHRWKERFLFALVMVVGRQQQKLKCELLNAVGQSFMMSVGTATIDLRSGQTTVSISNDVSLDLGLHMHRREDCRFADADSESSSPRRHQATTVCVVRLHSVPADSTSVRMTAVDPSRPRVSYAGRVLTGCPDEWTFECPSDAVLQCNVDDGKTFGVYWLARAVDTTDEPRHVVLPLSRSTDGGFDDSDELAFDVLMRRQEFIPLKQPRPSPLPRPLVFPSTFAGGSSSSQAQDYRAALATFPLEASVSSKKLASLLEQRMIKAAAGRVGRRHWSVRR